MRRVKKINLDRVHDRKPDSKVSARAHFGFVLDALEGVEVFTKPMFGCLAIYVAAGQTGWTGSDEDRIALILRSARASAADNGVWIATTREHHESLRRELPSMRSLTVFGPGETGWQVIPEDAPHFEREVLHACALVRAGDARIGKIPKKKKPRRAVSRRAHARRPV